MSQPLLADGRPADSLSADMLSTFCTSEAWQGDLSTGLMRIGETSAQVHGISPGHCGLLSLVRAYDAEDRLRVLELFEQAAACSSSFCFSTSVVQPHGGRQPLFCVGQSTGLERRYCGQIDGVFFFPNFQTWPVGPALHRQ
ncbi:hypothetical protein ACEVQ6_00510 [Ciceribacter sp. sgz301302]